MIDDKEIQKVISKITKVLPQDEVIRLEMVMTSMVIIISKIYEVLGEDTAHRIEGEAINMLKQLSEQEITIEGMLAKFRPEHMLTQGELFYYYKLGNSIGEA